MSGRTNPTSTEVALLVELEEERKAFRDHVRKLERELAECRAERDACARAFLALGRIPPWPDPEP